MAEKDNRFLETLAQRHRVILLGGLAVIAHGLSRSTYDVDIWLEPMSSAREWSEALLELVKEIDSSLTIHRLPNWTRVVDRSEIEEAIKETGIIRILGLQYPLDIFRRPNEFEIDEFEQVFHAATRIEDGTYLPEPLDLIQSKTDTGRDKDTSDIVHLENVIRAQYRKRLPSSSLAEAERLLARFVEPAVLEITLTNPNQDVQSLAKGYLQEFADQGDPFSRDILAQLES